jgi:hypothetical protein
MIKKVEGNILSIEKRIFAFVRLGEAIDEKVKAVRSSSYNDLDEIIRKAGFGNPWFTKDSILTAMTYWSEALKEDNLKRWLEPYQNDLNELDKQKLIGVVNAGNIPLVGFHDLLVILICGYDYKGKNATGDSLLLPYISQILCSIEPEFNKHIQFVDRLEKMHAVIATGSNNTARYFEYYFGKYPNVIRKNRNGVALLSGNESAEQLHEIGKDIFTYFGLGCRNISKIYVPEGYKFNFLFESIESYKEMMNHHKYMNNFDYNHSILLLKKIPFLQNGFLIIRNEKNIASSISVIHSEEYSFKEDVVENIKNNLDQIQCIVADKKYFSNTLQSIIDFGKTQKPELWDYADGVDTVKFCLSL